MSDEGDRLEFTIGLLLLAGSWLSTLLLVAGLALRVLVGPDGASPVLLTYGLIVLMGTPVLRVFVSCVEYFRERDWLFAISTLTVLVVLAMSLAVAFA